MGDCQNKTRNMRYCNCSYSCGKKGVCCDCLAYHRGMGELPACYFPSEAEKTGDRSIENFIRIYTRQGGKYLR